MKYKFIFDMDGTIYQFDDSKSISFTESRFYKDIRQKAIVYIATLAKCDLQKAERWYEEIKYDFNGDVSIGCEMLFGCSRYDYFANVWNFDPAKYIKKDALLRKELSSLEGTLILLTAAPRVWADRVLSYLELGDVFKDRIYTGEPDVRKPSVASFTQIYDRFGGVYDDYVSIGDQNASDILPAKALGMRTVLIDREVMDADDRVDDVFDAIELLKEFER